MVEGVVTRKTGMAVPTMMGRRHVIVAGAGLAGLTAAVELEKQGARVTVIEARGRVGGRVWTLREPFEEDQHAEAGGDLIEPEQEAICRLVEELGLSLVPILRNGFAFVRRGASARAPTSRSSAAGVWTQLAGLCEPWIAAYRVSEQRWDGAVAQQLAKQSVADWLDEIRADPTLRARLNGLRGFFLADPEELSLLALIDQLASESSGPSCFYRVKGGNDRLATRLAERLRKDVHVRTRLQAVKQQGNTVTVTVGDAAGRTQIKADYLILALPATLLRLIAFSPLMPALQQRAIHTLHYGRATKTLLQFDRRFWQRRGRAWAYGTDLPIGALWDGNEQQRSRPGILTLLAGGTASRETKELIDRLGTQGIVNWLRWLGAAKAKLLEAQVVCWEDDELARGGYAVFQRGYDPSLRTWLARPHGRILFAGEHTSWRWQGYMNGAVESGLRAAAEVRALAARAAGG
jgi:monoamine oxidase